MHRNRDLLDGTAIVKILGENPEDSNDEDLDSSDDEFNSRPEEIYAENIRHCVDNLEDELVNDSESEVIRDAFLPVLNAASPLVSPAFLSPTVSSANESIPGLAPIFPDLNSPQSEQSSVHTPSRLVVASKDSLSASSTSCVSNFSTPKSSLSAISSPVGERSTRPAFVSQNRKRVVARRKLPVEDCIEDAKNIKNFTAS